MVMIHESLERSKGRPGLRPFAPASSTELQDGLASLGSTQDLGQGKLVRSSRCSSHDDDNDNERKVMVVMIPESLERSKGRPGLRPFAPASSPELQDGLASLGSTQDLGQGKLVRSLSCSSHDDDNDHAREVLVVMIHELLERSKGRPGPRPFAPAASPELQDGLASLGSTQDSGQGKLVRLSRSSSHDDDNDRARKKR
jgi:hypothetical protein